MKSLPEMKSLKSLPIICAYAVIGLGLATAILGFATSALAEEATDNPVAIKLLKSLGIKEITKMNLGGVYSPVVDWGRFDTLILYQSNGRLGLVEYDEDINATIPPTTSATQRGEILITGTPSEIVNLSMVGGTLSNGTTNMKIRGIQIGRSGPHRLDSNGMLTLLTGIEISYSGTPTLGAYTGTYTVTVNYP
ncbi:DUF4402 domain-containing protein [Sneathiella marina]|uniref:DUF4402 domain-containing protein n=1 Tax=Sneathiella marina TaxID=2950108 RepID=A0ABY4VYH8_9PROT|nr:DUF4402 domain-containing protein [Sneathiella marina]USG59752.1 DUF4402 domain-containing protein [Sneathiella marina]